MEIGPVSKIQALPGIKPEAVKSGQWAVFDVENTAHADDETYSPSGQESVAGDEDEFDESHADEQEEPQSDEFDESHPEEQDQAEVIVEAETAPAPAPKDEQSVQVSLFA